MAGTFIDVFSHATESPYSTSIGETETSIYTAKQIANFVLAASGLSPTEKGRAEAIAKQYDMLEYRGAQHEVINRDEVYSFECVLAIAHFYDKVPDTSISRAVIATAHAKCVRAINSLTYFLQAPHDRTSRLPAPGYLSLGERWKLDRTWDICVCLLGAIKARCGFERKILFDEIPVVQDIHYRRHAKIAVDMSKLSDKRRICPKALNLLTRPEIAPYIQPMHLFMKIDDAEDVKQFKHTDCTVQKCKFDFDPDFDIATVDRHVPGCDKNQCTKVRRPEGSLGTFDNIAGSGMPAVNISAEDSNPDTWWVKADGETLAVSHVWRDGIHGTRDEGLNKCIHDLLVKIAKDKGCKSYWIDCATIPNDSSRPDIREGMIKKINKTFHHAKAVLCWDQGFANNRHLDLGMALLLLIVSPWHRRAWTLLEGNRAQFDRMHFLRWNGDNGDFELFSLKENVLRAFGPRTGAPLWIQSALVELLPYSNATMSMEVAGLLLTGRHATRPGDSETIWGLLRPVVAIGDVTDLQFDDPYFYARGKADVAFLSSNATRFRGEQLSRSWKPGKTDATAWVRRAYGGIEASIEEDGRRLACDWWVKKGQELRRRVDWRYPLGVDAKQFLSRWNDPVPSNQTFALICPILRGDPITPNEAGERHSESPVEAVFRTSISMECSRAIVVTKVEGDPAWQWQTIVNLTEPLIFTTRDMEHLIIESKRTD